MADSGDPASAKDVVLGVLATLGSIGTAVFGFRAATLKRRTDAEATLLTAYRAEHEAHLAEREKYEESMANFFDCRAALDAERAARMRAEVAAQREIHRVESNMAFERALGEKEIRELRSMLATLQRELVDLRRKLPPTTSGDSK